MTLEWLTIISASLLAGAVDAMAGGGGLLTVPALFGSYPQLSPALLLGTNKSGSVFGTLVAAWRYGRHLQLQLQWLLAAAMAAFTGSLLGAWTLTQLDAHVLRSLCPWLLVAMLVYTLLQPRLGLQQSPTVIYKHTFGMLVLVVGVGWYDGFFGPGTGSLFILLLVRGLGMDFLHASAHAKVLNAATNLAALMLLAGHGQVWWQLGLSMAVANMLGSLIGARLAMRHGSTLIRQVFLVVILALIVKTAYDAYA